MAYECSCGRQFANATSLERHQWVTKHEGSRQTTANPPAQEMAVPAPLDPNRQAVRQALEVIGQKQDEQKHFDQQRRARRKLENQRNHWKRRLRLATEEALQALDGGAEQLHQGGILALRLMLALAVLATMFWAGVHFLK